MALASETASKVRPDYDIPVEMRKRKRGKKGGVRARLRKRKFRPALPSIVTGNCRSLRNKLDELKACVNYRYEYRDSCMMCFSGTWFSPRDSESSTAIEGFTCVRNDRTSDSGKSTGGGVCAYVNERWCNASNISVKAHHCSQDIELLCIGIRPHYLPREFTQLYVIVVYIQPKADVDVAAAQIQNVLQRNETASPDSVQLVMGDFNSCDLRGDMPHLHQYIDVSTRGSNILDKCYGNVQDGYKAVAKPPLGSSDHNIIQLLPRYRQKLKRIRTYNKESDLLQPGLKKVLRL